MTHLTRKLLSTIALGLMSLVLSAAVAQAQDSKIVKIIGNAQGATITRNGATIQLTEGMPIQVKDIINTGAGVDVYVQPYAGVVATVKQNSHVGVSMLAADDAELDLTVAGGGGSVVAQIEPNKGHKFGVRTPKGVAAAKGTVYTVVSDGVTYHVETFAGSVTITPIPDPANPNAPLPPAITLGAGTSTGGTSEQNAVAASIALAAVAVVAQDTNLGSASTTAGTELSVVMNSIIKSSPEAVGTAVASAASAAPGQATNLVQTAVTQAANLAQSGSTVSVANIAQQATQGATTGLKSPASGTESQTSGSTTTATTLATAAVNAAKSAGVTDTTQLNNIATGAVTGAASGSGQNATDIGTTVQTNTATSVSANPTNTNANATPITTIDPGIKVSPSGG